MGLASRCLRRRSLAVIASWSMPQPPRARAGATCGTSTESVGERIKACAAIVSRCVCADVALAGTAGLCRVRVGLTSATSPRTSTRSTDSRYGNQRVTIGWLIEHVMTESSVAISWAGFIDAVWSEQAGADEIPADGPCHLQLRAVSLQLPRIQVHICHTPVAPHQSNTSVRCIELLC